MKKNKKKTILGTIIVVMAMAMGINICSNGETTNISNASNQRVEVKKVGTKRLEKAEDKKKTLAKEKKDKEKEYQKLKDQLADQKEKEAKEQKQAKEQKEKKAQAKAKKVQENQEQARQSNSTTSSTSSDTETSAAGNHGDLNTAATGQIVGNARSHIYHVPGQAGYHMNSSNAVYFNSEQDAINAGYRKALR